MPRTRYIKPEFFEDKTLAKVPHSARLLYIGLWCWTDRAGVFEYDVDLIKLHIFPFDDTKASDIEQWLQCLINQNRIKKLEHEGKSYGFIPKFFNHQWFHGGEKAKYGIPLDKLKRIAENPAKFCSTTEQVQNNNRTSLPIIGTVTGIGIVSTEKINTNTLGAKGNQEGIQLERCIQEWKLTLKHFQSSRNLIANEEMTLLRKIKQSGYENVIHALIGARHEPKTENFDPAKCLDLQRVLGNQFMKNVSRGVQVENKKKRSHDLRNKIPKEKEFEGRQKADPKRVRELLKCAGFHHSPLNKQTPLKQFTSLDVEKEKKRQLSALKKKAE
jgi:hypothetical protein